MNTVILSLFTWLLCGCLWADPFVPKGIIILTSASGLDPRNITFSDLTWTDFEGGEVIATSSHKTGFATKDIGKIIYFDSNYYSQLDNDQQEKAYRAGIQAREVVVDTSFLNLNSTTGSKVVQNSQSTLESLTHEHPAIQSMVQPQIDLLKADIAKLTSGQVLQDGKWMAQRDAGPQAPPTIGGGAQMLTFTTKKGKHYENAKADVTDTGVSVLTADGGTTIPFDQLPDDLSSFPDSARKLIAEKRQQALVDDDHVTATNNVSNNSPPPSANPTFIDEIEKDPTGPIWNTYNEENKLGEIAAALDQKLPSDVMTALTFIRDHLNPSEHVLVVPDKGLLVISLNRTGIFVGSIKDLNPDDILFSSRSSTQPTVLGYKEYGPDVTTTICSLSMYTTGRTPRVTIYRSLDGSRVITNKGPGLRVLTDNEAVSERLAKAFGDIINYYGGTPEETIADVNTDKQLITFIQNKMCKSAPTPVEITFDVTTGEVYFNYGKTGWWATQTGKINIKNIKPDDFVWSKSGDAPSTLSGGLPGRAFDLANEKDAEDVATAFTRFCTLHGWQPSKY